MADAAALYDDAGFVHEAGIARRGLQKGRAEATSGAPSTPLTQREMEVLRLVAQGMSEREVADKLFISHHTAHRHLTNIRLKLNATTQAAAVAHALRVGLI
jgi:DNA-binding CsgD family transcriptional regulator